jgi:hypothetical protein
MCIVTTLNKGLRNGGGIGDVLRQPSSQVRRFLSVFSSPERRCSPGLDPDFTGVTFSASFTEYKFLFLGTTIFLSCYL